MSEQEIVPESLGDVLRASFDKVTSTTDETPAPTGDEPPVPTTDETPAPTGDETPAPASTTDETPVPASTTDETPAPTGDDIPPARFATGAQVEWDKVPAPVKTEVHRAIAELTTGIDGYRERLQSFNGLEPYAEMAKQAGTTIDAALKHYTGLEMVLSENPVVGLRQICENIGIDPKQAGELLAGQQPSTPDEKDRVIADLRQQVAYSNSQLTSIRTQQQSEVQQRAKQEIDTFAIGKPDFSVLKETMGRLITAKQATGLQDAYDQARALNPHLVAKPSAPPKKAVQTDLKAQTRKGSLTPTGAPKTPSGATEQSGDVSIADALKDAISKVTG